MQWPTAKVSCIAVLVATSHYSEAQAASQEDSGQPAEYSAEVAVGIEYDSNVAVDELDNNSNQDDYATTLDLELGVDKAISGNTELGLSYDFSQNLYGEFDTVNRQTHLLGANLEHALSAADIGLTAFYIDSRLDGEKFLELVRVSPSVSGFIDKRWFGRSAYVYSEKTLADNATRDATTHAGEADIYFFRRGLRSYFNFGYRYKDEDANAAQYDYRSHGVKFRYIHRIELPSRWIKLELAWRYEMRDYSSPTPSIEATRDDRRQRVQFDMEIPIKKQAALQLYTSYGDYRSNYAPSDYSQGVVGSRFIYRW